MPDEILLNNVGIIDGYNALHKGRGEILSKKHLRIVKLITQFERQGSIGLWLFDGEKPDIDAST